MNLHARIMNLPAEPQETTRSMYAGDAALAYKLGHRDARHAAAELAISADAEIARLRAALKQADADLEALTGEPHIDGYPLLSGLPKRDPEGRKHPPHGVNHA